MWRRILYTYLIRPFKNFNVDNRAERIMEKNKVKSPPHPTTVEPMKKINEEYQDKYYLQKEKNENLHTMMQGMIANPDKVQEFKPRNLPLSQEPALDGYFEYEPDKIPEGHCTFKDAMIFITSHHYDPTDPEFTSQAIATKFKLNTTDVENILRYVKPFQLYLPEDLSKTPALVSAAPERQLAEGSVLKDNADVQADIEKQRALLRDRSIRFARGAQRLQKEFGGDVVILNDQIRSSEEIQRERKLEQDLIEALKEAAEKEQVKEDKEKNIDTKAKEEVIGDDENKVEGESLRKLEELQRQKRQKRMEILK